MHILHHGRSLSPLSPKPYARLPQPCQNFQAVLQAGRSPRLPVCPFATALGTHDTSGQTEQGGQWDNEGKRSTNPQGNWVPRKCPRHLPALRGGISSPSLPDAPAQTGKPVLGCLSRVLRGGSFFWALLWLSDAALARTSVFPCCSCFCCSPCLFALSPGR